MKKILSLSAAIILTAPSFTFAQQGVHSSGGNAAGPGGSVSYSVGQVFYSSQSSTTGGLIQGVQQPFELVVTEIPNRISSGIKCEVFPNPVVKELKVRVAGKLPENASWKLTDLKGVTLLKGDLTQNETGISMAALPMAGYLLQVYSGSSELSSFKVIKQ